MIDVPALLAALAIRVEKRAGKRLWAKCPSPDHDDHNPSWFIWCDPDSSRHGRHRCYGCGFRGGPLALVREIQGGDWDDARQWLDDGQIRHTPLDIHLEIREHRSIEAVAPPDWVQFADDYQQWPTLAVRYLTGDKRRIGIDTVRRWGLGFIAKGDASLAGRIWIPIRDPQRRLISWQARTYIDDDLRYNMPSRANVTTFLGAEHWPEAEDRKVVVVVEGPFDALSVDRATRLPVAAIIGSNPNGRQLSALSTFDHVLVMTDADTGGDKAAAMLQGLARWTTVTRVRLGDGQDPGGATDATLRDALRDWL